MGNNLPVAAQSYVRDAVAEQLQLPFAAAAGSGGAAQRRSKEGCDTGGSYGGGGKKGDRSCYERNGCVKRTCGGPMAYFGDPTFFMSMGLWTLRLGFPLLGWFFFVAIGKYCDWAHPMDLHTRKSLTSVPPTHTMVWVGAWSVVLII